MPSHHLSRSTSAIPSQQIHLINAISVGQSQPIHHSSATSTVPAQQSPLSISTSVVQYQQIRLSPHSTFPLLCKSYLFRSRDILVTPEAGIIKVLDDVGQYYFPRSRDSFYFASHTGKLCKNHATSNIRPGKLRTCLETVGHIFRIKVMYNPFLYRFLLAST